jgi:hypothetical protein
MIKNFMKLSDEFFIVDIEDWFEFFDGLFEFRDRGIEIIKKIFKLARVITLMKFIRNGSKE